MTADDLTCNTKQLASILGVSTVTVAAWTKAGMPKLAKGRYDLPAVVPWALEHVTGNDKTTEEARRALYVAQERHKSLETRILAGSVVPADDIRHFCHALASLYTSSLEALAPRLGGELADIDRPELVEAVLERESRAIREQLAVDFAAFAERLDRIHPDNQPAAKSPRGRVGGRKPRTARPAGTGPVAH